MNVTKVYEQMEDSRMDRLASVADNILVERNRNMNVTENEIRNILRGLVGKDDKFINDWFDKPVLSLGKQTPREYIKAGRGDEVVNMLTSLLPAPQKDEDNIKKERKPKGLLENITVEEASEGGIISRNSPPYPKPEKLDNEKGNSNKDEKLDSPVRGGQSGDSESHS